MLVVETEADRTQHDIQALQQNVDPKCRWKLLKALGLTVDAAMKDVLRHYLSDSNAKVREEAARALAGYPEGQDVLKAAISGNTDEGLITAAAPFVEDIAFLEALSERLSPKGRISVLAAAKQKARR